MTWTKLGTEFSDEAANVDLSDAAYRTHVEAIQFLYNVEQTDCLIPARLARRFASSPHWEMAITELVSHGWWRINGQGYEVVHHGDVIRASIVTQQKKRAASKATSARYRRAHNSADVTPDVTRHADSQTDKQLDGGTHYEAETGWTLPSTPGSGGSR